MQARAFAEIEETFLVPVTVTDRHGAEVRQSIVVTSLRKAGLKRYPLLVLNHGRAPDAYARALAGQIRLRDAAVHFASLGFAVMVPTRIGYGATGGPDVEDSGPCARKDYFSGFEAAAQQIQQVMVAAGARPEIDLAHIVVVGQSFGGAAAIATAARSLPGVRLVVNFAGGAGADPVTRPGEPCSPQRLSDVFAGYGRTTRVPTLWIYTSNDRYMGSHPLDWFDAFREAGGTGEFKAMPAFGSDGHQLFARGLRYWRPVVDDALRAAGFDIPAH